jgi:CIC family chloride channel protein
MTSRQPQNLLVAAVRRLHTSETSGLILLSIAVGLGAGLGAVAFRWLIASAQHLFFGGGHHLLGFMGHYFVIIVPGAGGLLVGLLTYYGAREARGHGVPEVMMAVISVGGRIRPRVAVIKSLASAICIGSGGSAGREGPIVQIGSALGSSLAQLLRLPEERVRLLVACGAAGGISATFNAPVAGVIFALEIILREFAVRSFGFVVFASVAAAAVSRAMLGDRPSFLVPHYQLVSAWEFPLYILLGLLAAVVSVIFVKALYGCEDVFDRWRVPEYVKPVIGGLLVGTIGVWFPQVFGVGYGPQPVGHGQGALDLALLGKIGLGMCAWLAMLKLVATALSIGSGGSGGVFAPSLFTGATLGGAFGLLVHHFWPGFTAGSGAYSLVAMGAVFAGAAHAPITSVLILFEMTGDYRIILPLMTAVVTASLVAQRLSKDNIYTLKIRRRGIDPDAEPVSDLLDTVTVAEAMTTDFETVSADLPVVKLADRLVASGTRGLPVVDAQGELLGIVTLSDIQRSAVTGDADRTVADIATLSPVTCFPDQTVRDALQQLQGREVSRLPVVDRLDPRHLVGVLRMEDVVAAYARLLDEHASVRAASERLRLSVPGLVTVRVEIPKEAQVVGRALRGIPMPADALLVAVRRGGRVMLPAGDTSLAPGDLVTALAAPAHAEALKDLLTRVAPSSGSAQG